MRQTIFILMELGLLFSCNSSGKTKVSAGTTPINQQTSPTGADTSFYKNDSLELVKLLQDVYKWHDQNQRELLDFDVVIKDSFQTGLNYKLFKRTFDAIKKSGYFSVSFLNNYKKIGEYINDKLANANPKYSNEINFACQEADPWTNFQDDAPDFWNKLKIVDFKSSLDQASLQWQTQIEDWSSEKYAVKFVKENGKWKVSYMDGFDMNKYYQ
ncbi:MAG: hypothetical protein ACJ75B_03610 [Flavisolibacter sp.]